MNQKNKTEDNVLVTVRLPVELYLVIKEMSDKTYIKPANLYRNAIKIYADRYLAEKKRYEESEESGQPNTLAVNHVLYDYDKEEQS